MTSDDFDQLVKCVCEEKAFKQMESDGKRNDGQGAILTAILAKIDQSLQSSSQIQCFL